MPVKALVPNGYGSPEVLRVGELRKPSPKDNEILIKVHASSVNALDWHFMRGAPFLIRLQFGMFRPKVKVLGYDVAGTIEEVGKDVTPA